MAKINVKVDVGQEGQSRFVNKTIDVPDNYRFLNSHAIDQNQFEQLQKMPENMRGMAMVGQRSIQNPSGTMQSAATDYQLALRSQGVKPQDFAGFSAQEYHKRKASSNFGNFMPLRPAFHQADVAAKDLEQSGQAEMFGAGAGAIPFGLGGVAALGFGKLTQLGIGAASRQLTRMGVGELTKKIGGYGLGSIALGHYGYETYKHGGPLSGLRQGNLNFASGFEAISDLTLTKDLFKGAAGIAKGFFGKKTPSVDAAGKSAGAEGPWDAQRWVNSLNKKMREMGIPGFQPKVEQGKLYPGAAGYVNRKEPGTIFKTFQNVFTGEHAYHEGFHLKQNQEELILESLGKAGEAVGRVAESAGKIGQMVPGLRKAIQENPLYKGRDPHSINREMEAYGAGVYGSDFLRSKPRQFNLSPAGKMISKAIGISDDTAKEFMRWGAKRYTQLVQTQKNIGMGGLKSYSKEELSAAKKKLIDVVDLGKKKGINVESLENRLKEIDEFQKTGKVPDAEGPRRVRGEERKEPDFGKPYPFEGEGGGGGGTATLEAPPKAKETVKTKPQTEAKPQTETKPKTEVEKEVKPDTEAPSKTDTEKPPKTDTEAPSKTDTEAPTKPDVKKPVETAPKTDQKPAIGPKVAPRTKPKTEPKPEVEVEPEVDVKPDVKNKPKLGNAFRPEDKPGIRIPPPPPPVKIEPVVPPVKNRFEDIQQIEYGFFEMGGYWLPAAPSFHAGQWATPAYIINSGRLEYNVDE
jgi:hypothetical protein